MLPPPPTFQFDPNGERGVKWTEHPSHQKTLSGDAQLGANQPERYELFLLGDNEKKVTWVLDTRVPNTAIFTFNKEDHTLGNLLTARLHKYPYVHFSAYKVPHPLFATFDMRVTTDGSITPKDAIIQACRDIVQDLEKLSQEFTKEWELKKIANTGRE